MALKLLRNLCLTLVVASSLWGMALAQDLPDFEAFNSFANSVETDLQENRLSDDGFEALRADLVDWRQKMQAAETANEVQIEALTAQIETLGAPPAEGETEPETIARRRAELADDLAVAREPSVSAQEARACAAALIGRIDDTLRARQTDALFQHDGSPLDPTRWGPAFDRAARVVADIRNEVSANIALQTERGDLANRLPIVVLLVALALVLVTRGPRWFERLIARIEARSTEQGRIVYGFLVSLGAIVAPLVGITLLNVALISSGVLGRAAVGASVGINTAIFAYALSRWLGRRLFPERDIIPSPLLLTDGQRAEGRFLAVSLGVVLGLLLLVRVLGEVESLDVESLGVFSFPLFVLLALILFRMGRLLKLAGLSEADTAAEATVPGYIGRALGKGVQSVAIVGGLAATAGYFNMAQAILIPTALSLALLAFLATLHFVTRATFGLLRGLNAEDAASALTPVLISFALALASFPLFALIWGARANDIGEIWTRFRSGVQLGETTISPGSFVTFGIVFALCFLLTRLVQGALRSSVLPRTRIDRGGQNAIVSGLGYLGITLAVVAGVTSAGIDLSSLAIVVGALGVGIGFGLQNIVNNFVSGIILLIERPISEGDWVEVNGQMGTVRAISVRSTIIETFDRTDVIVPNGDLISGTVTNWTRGNSIGRVIVPVGVAYGTDTRKVEALLMEIAKAHPIVTVNPPPQILFINFGADSLEFEIRAILTDVSFLLSVKSDINHEIARRFGEEGIEIPFAQRDIWLRNPEALAATAAAVTAPRSPSGPSDRSLMDPDAGEPD